MEEYSGARGPIDQACTEKELDRALFLLSEALSILDSLDLPLHIGARLDHVIREIQGRGFPERQRITNSRLPH